MDKIKKGLLIGLYLLVLLHHYIEVPYFIFLISLFVALLLIAVWKETTDFDKRIDRVPYDFRIQKITKKSTKGSIITTVLLLLFLIAPNYIEFPFEQRESVEALFPFYLVLLVLPYLALLFEPQYDYYHFGKRGITGPGPALKPIPWNQIRAVETKKEEEAFYLNLKRGSKIKFDLKQYYSDRKWEEVMTYLQDRNIQIMKA